MTIADDPAVKAAPENVREWLLKLLSSGERASSEPESQQT